MLTFRPAKPDDLSVVHEIEQERFGMDAFPKQQLKGLIRNTNVQFVLAIADEAVLGYFILLFRSNSRQARIYSIAVASGSEGKGVGQQIMLKIEEVVLQRQCFRLKLEVRKDNTRAIELYKRNGFVVKNTIEDYYKDKQSALVMIKKLRHETA